LPCEFREPLCPKKKIPSQACFWHSRRRFNFRTRCRAEFRRFSLSGAPADSSERKMFKKSSKILKKFSTTPFYLG